MQRFLALPRPTPPLFSFSLLRVSYLSLEPRNQYFASQKEQFPCQLPNLSLKYPPRKDESLPAGGGQVMPWAKSSPDRLGGLELGVSKELKKSGQTVLVSKPVGKRPKGAVGFLSMRKRLFRVLQRCDRMDTHWRRRPISVNIAR